MSKIKVAITHDVDRIKKSYQYITKSIKAIYKLDFNALQFQISDLFNNKDTFWNFDDILNIENNYKIKSTFFFLNESLPFNPVSIKNWPLSLGRYKITNPRIIEIIKHLDNNGFEIGVHGSFNSYNDINLLIKEKNELEKIVNKNIIGIRQHHLNLNNNTWKLQYEAGFKYDTSLGSNDEIGFINNKIKMFHPLSNELTVFPMALMDKTFCYDTNKWEKLERIIEIIKKNEGILVLNWHTDTFNSYEYPGFKDDFIKLIQLLIEKGATFDTLSNYYKTQKECAA